ncbi:MAG TPA: DMT family transporter, partial [Pseudomonadota bacterium]|nr:DMT family transporter [Pseudomonadota bacterium]
RAGQGRDLRERQARVDVQQERVALRGRRGLQRIHEATIGLGVIWLGRYRRQGPKASEGERLLLSPKEMGRFAPAVLLEAFIGSSIFVFAMTHTDLSIAAPLAALSPLFSVPIGVLLGTETLNLRRVLAILVTVAGVVCLVTA